MTKFKHFETESGKIIMTAQFDGYDMANRIFEGLMFQITVQPDGTLKASVKPEDEDFFSDFNTVKWLKTAEEFAQKYDIFIDPISDEECWLVSDSDSSNNQTPSQVIQKTPLSVVLGASNNPHTSTHSCGPNCNHNHSNPTGNSNNILDELFPDNKEENIQSEAEKEPVIGKFKPKRKFLYFLQYRQGGIRYHNNVALLKGDQLSGMIEDVIFKVTICDEGTINFEETDTNKCDDVMIQRFIDDIDSRDVTGYMKKYVVHGLEFLDEDGKKMYLEVEEKKPIDKLFALFDELKEPQETETNMDEIDQTPVQVSDNALSLLDSLFGDETTTQEEIKVVEAVPQETYAQQMMREAFEAMNSEKVIELTDRIEKKEKEITKCKLDLRQTESNLKTASEDIRVLYTRLDSLKPADAPNGYAFYVSPENKSGVVLDKALQDVVKQISPLLKLKEDAVIDYLTKGFFTIRIAKKDDLTNDNVSIEKEIYEKINKLDITGKVSLVGNGEFEYRGELTWHKLVDKMIRLGFEQEPEFDKQCGSPSYKSEEESGGFTLTLDSVGNLTQTNNSSAGNTNPFSYKDEDETDPDILREMKKFTENPEGQVFCEFTEPTTLVILGDSPDNYSTSSNPQSIQITDDETSFSLFVGGKRTHQYLGSMGFADVFTLDEYKKYYSKNKEMLLDTGLISGVVLPNFVGKIEVAAYKESKKGFKFSSQFVMNDFIQHQFEEAEVAILLPEGTAAIDLNEDCSLPISIIRDIKIDSLIK